MWSTRFLDYCLRSNNFKVLPLKCQYLNRGQFLYMKLISLITILNLFHLVLVRDKLKTMTKDKHVTDLFVINWHTQNMNHRLQS